MILGVVPVDVLLPEQREELAAQDFEVPFRRRRVVRVRARRGQELHEPLRVARERHAFGGELAHHAEHGMRRSWRW